MCGLCGIVHRDPSFTVDEQVLIAMRESMLHRGPDDAGQFVGPGVGLASRRLAILDLSERGRMPMSTADGRYHIVYNGEVYNNVELRDELRAKGFSFRSQTDTEVVLNLFVSEGPAMLARLNGMFAIAVWDTRERTLFLARDRLGIKPLYYAWNAGVLHFASEEKGLFAAGVPARFDPEVWEELLCFRYVAGDRTPFTNVRRLLPGHYLLCSNGHLRIRRWWHLGERINALKEHTPSRLTRWFREIFDDAVGLRRISDVPLGVLLSGGLDSGSVGASLATQAGAGVESFTVTFDERVYDEGPLAKLVADRWHLKYHQLKVATDQLLPQLFRASWLNDEPLVHGNELHMLAISEYAKPIVTVLLSGEGGDETLGGYVRYRPLRYPTLLDLARRFAPRVALTLPLNGRTRKLARLLGLGSADSFVMFNSCEVLPSDLPDLGMASSGRFEYRESVLAEAKEIYPGDLIRQAMYTDQHTFLCSLLDRNDRMTMGASIECRVPFLDHRIVEVLGALNTPALLAHTKSKALLRDAVGDRLPKAVLRARKWGFGVPWGQHFRKVPELREVVQSLPASPVLGDGPFDKTALERVVRSFLAGDTRKDALVRQLATIDIWYRACVVPQVHVPSELVRD